ncbi:MAG: DeoR family transcriptional regulator [Salinivirgaceae bacterium]|jgi:ATP-dependent DNA helicase RecG|nr:DeoR family transcriptional regulator [Salinivirgaceae bacterium]
MLDGVNYVNDLDNDPDKRLEIIMGLIKQNNKILLKEISEQLKVSKSTVKRDIEKLKFENKLKRVGSEKGCHWQLKEGM